MLSLPSSSSSSFFNSKPTFSPPKPSTSVRLAGTVRASAAGATAARPTSYTTAASFYEILGIPAVATCQEIKAAYRRLARVCHPDVAAIDRKESSADEFMKIYDAYSTLSDPAKRADYDRRVLSFRRPLAVSGYNRRRNWETDQCW